MDRIWTEETGQGLRVVKALAPPEEVKQYEYELIMGGAVPGLFPVDSAVVKNAAVLSCAVGSSMVPLQSYFSGVVTQEVFMDTVSRILSIVRDCEGKRLDPRNLSFSTDTIFVNPQTRGVRCILWPVENNQSPSDPVDFFRELPYGVVFKKHEDHEQIAEYIQFFRPSAKPVTIRNFERLVCGEAPGAVAPAPVGKVAEPNAGPGQRNICPSCGIANAMNTKICISCGAGLVRSPSMDASKISQTGVLGYFPGSTELETEESPYPYLIRESTNQIISVDKPEFCIGKDQKQADFRVTDNPAVSRRHLVIITREDRYFIVDQNSTNKTYMDERPIPPGQETEIFPGAKLRLANEEFSFYI